jgi:hypothetical protein
MAPQPDSPPGLVRIELVSFNLHVFRAAFTACFSHLLHCLERTSQLISPNMNTDSTASRKKGREENSLSAEKALNDL